MYLKVLKKVNTNLKKNNNIKSSFNIHFEAETLIRLRICLGKGPLKKTAFIHKNRIRGGRSLKVDKQERKGWWGVRLVEKKNSLYNVHYF